MTKHAHPRDFFTPEPGENHFLSSSRIKEYAGMGEESFRRYLERNPLKAQEHEKGIFAVDGHHRIYTAHHHFNFNEIPYNPVYEFEKDDLAGPFTRVIDMKPVGDKEYKTSKEEDL